MSCEGSWTREPGGRTSWYTWVDSGHNQAELEAWATAPAPAASGRAGEYADLEHMLLQLKGMVLGM